MVCTSYASADDVVLSDAGVEITLNELGRAIDYFPRTMKARTFEDESARKDIAIQMLINKRIAEAARKVTEAENPEFYWKKVFYIQKALNELYLKDYEKTLETPDMTKLAQEKYIVNKDTYAKVAEKRGSSHILFKCLPGGCDREALRPTVKKVLLELINGANFEEMVKEYSEDYSSKARAGEVKDYYLGQAHVSQKYLEGLFAIEAINGYSDIIESKYGFHIIKLNKIIERSYKTFDEIKPILVEALKKKYRALSMKSYLKTFELSEESNINIKLMNDIFNKKKKEAEIEEAKKKPEVIQNSFK